ncbi:MAG: 2-dehydropantoate 2-reductase [Chloroflexota bacterium]
MVVNTSAVIVGAGGVGGYLGSHLARASRTSPLAVTLLARSPVVDAVARHGLVVREGDSETVTHPHTVSSAADSPPCDLVVLCVRNFDVRASIPDVRALLKPTGVLVALQNGVGSEEVVAAAVGRDRTIAGTLTCSVAVDAPGIVRRTSSRGGVALAMMSGGPIPDWVLAAFRVGGLATTAVEDYRVLRWSKLLLNMLGAAGTTILDADMRTYIDDSRLFRLEQLAFREATRVMARQGIRTTRLPGYPVPVLRRVMRLSRPMAQALIAPRLKSSRGGRSPAMRFDMKRGKTEVSWINGAVVNAARRLDLDTPVNRALTDLTEELVRHPAQRLQYAGQPDRLVAYMRERRILL